MGVNDNEAIEKRMTKPQLLSIDAQEILRIFAMIQVLAQRERRRMINCIEEKKKNFLCILMATQMAMQVATFICTMTHIFQSVMSFTAFEYCIRHEIELHIGFRFSICDEFLSLDFSIAFDMTSSCTLVYIFQSVMSSTLRI